MTAPELSYVALVVEEPETSAAIFEKDFGLPREFSLRRQKCAGDFRRPLGLGLLPRGRSFPWRRRP